MTKKESGLNPYLDYILTRDGSRIKMQPGIIVPDSELTKVDYFFLLNSARLIIPQNNPEVIDIMSQDLVHITNK